MPPIQLTDDNYYSQQANIDYMSVSQFKDLIGTLGHDPCEVTGVLRYQGILQQVESTPLLVGSFVDSYFEGTLDQFKEDHKDKLFAKTGATKGQLKSEFKQAEEIIDRINRDPLFSGYMSGQKQVIMTANLFGVDWKIKMDSYHPNKMIVDLKVMKNMAPIWSDKRHEKMDFIRYWGYDIQGAIYQKVVEIVTGYKLPFFIACATKESPTDIQIIEITQPYLDAALQFVEENIQHALDLKDGTSTPAPCNSCSYCKSRKVLAKPISIEDIIPKPYIASKEDASDDLDSMFADEGI
jgi:hypothetical protein